MEEKAYGAKLDTIYENTKTRTLEHLDKLRYAEQKEKIESDRIFEYLQQTIDCLQVCIQHLPKESSTRSRYAMYKDELGEIGEEIVKLTNPNRW